MALTKTSTAMIEQDAGMQRGHMGADAGGGGAHNNVQPILMTNYIVKTWWCANTSFIRDRPFLHKGARP